MEILENVIGYGIDITEARWNRNFHSQLYSLVRQGGYGIWDLWQDWCEDHFDDYDRDEEDAWDAFCDEGFEDPETMDYGTDAMLTIILNEKYFGGRRIFQNMDGCIYVETYIPETDADKAFMPSREKIRSMLAETVNPLLAEPLPVDFLIITLS